MTFIKKKELMYSFSTYILNGSNNTHNTQIVGELKINISI